MGQRYVELNTSYTVFEGNSSATIHVAQLPPNPAIIAPGPAFVFVVVNGVPSIGQQVMLGSGQLGTQTVLAVSALPVASVVPAPAATTSSAANTKSAGVAISPCLPACFGGSVVLFALAAIALWT